MGSLTNAPRRRWTLSSVVASALLLVAAVVASSASANVVWWAGAEQPASSEWASSCADPPGYATAPPTTQGPDVNSFPITRSSTVKAKGTYSWRFQVEDGDACGNDGESPPIPERAELAQGNPTRSPFSDSRLFSENEDRWISFQVYLPTNFITTGTGGRGEFQGIAQWKQLGGLGTPALSLGVENGLFKLSKSDSNGNTNGGVTLASAPVVKNRWVKFSLHVKFSPSSLTGFVEWYGDTSGTMATLLPRTYTYTMKQSGGVAVQSHARIGIYRGGDLDGTQNSYYDGYTVATTRAEAEARSWGPDFGANLYAGQHLDEGEYLTSQDGNYKLTLQLDCNLVERNASGSAIWSTGTGGSACHLNMQHDGNLVLYNGTGSALWSSGTYGSGDGNRLSIRNDGNVVIYNANDQEIWRAP